jgi:hypothetical protein
MKLSRLGLFLFLPLAVCAADKSPPATVTLRAGRVLHDAVVKSERATAVTFLCKEGLVSVAKTDLPPDLAARYPIDPGAKAKEAARENERAEKAEQARSKEAALYAEKKAAKRYDGLEIMAWEPFRGIVKVTLLNYTNLPQSALVSRLVLRKKGIAFEGDYITGVPVPESGVIHVPGGVTKLLYIRFRELADSEGAEDLIWAK